MSKHSKSILREFEINLLGLSYKTHDFEFQVTDEFFDAFEDSPIEKGDIIINLKLDKTRLMITANFSMKGEVELTCDRSLEPFMFPIDVQHEVYFKYGDNYEEIDEQLYRIPHDYPVLSLGQVFYEYICLPIPYRKLHPKFKSEELEEEDILYSTNPDESEEPNEEDNIDPRWSALKNLNKNNRK